LGATGFVLAPAARPDIACPNCGFRPWPGLQWICAPDGCGGQFDTFETQAHCPYCDAQFAWTGCPACHVASAHRAWYRASGGNLPNAARPRQQL